VQTPVPPLNGRPAADTASQMAAFKSGERKGTIMDRIAKGFTEEETRAIAAWYEQQK
jgi:cytochrome c553